MLCKVRQDINPKLREFAVEGVQPGQFPVV
jgi:hypothetical protein